jgi:DNA repair protein RAD50
MPPNIKSGQAFIHDPKLSGETETKAQITLRIRDTVGNEIVVVRSFQLIQKASKMQFQKVDQSLQMVDAAGKKQVVTYKCADIDATVPMLLGVSQAVLENVIFVHQEDSNWPLGESKTVKARFEAIFESAKYVKAMETIRKLKNEKNAAVKNLRLELEHLRTKVAIVQDLRAEIEKDEKEVRGAQETIAGIEGDLSVVQGRLSDLDGELARTQAAAAELTAVEAKLEVVCQRNLDMQQALPEEYDESEPELRSLVAKVNARVPEIEDDLQGYGRELHGLQSRVQELQAEHAQNERAFGKLSAEEAACEAKEVELRSLSAEVIAKYGLLDEGAPLEGEAEGRVKLMQCKVEELEQKWNAAMEKRDAEDQELSAAVDRAAGEWTKNAQALELMQGKKARLSREREDAEAELRKLGEEERAVLEASEREHEAKAELEATQAAARGRPDEEGTPELQQRLFSLEQEEAGLGAEHERLRAVAKEHILHAEKQKDLALKLEQISSLEAAHADDVRAALGDEAECPPGELQARLAAAAAAWQEKGREQERSVAEASRNEATRQERLTFLEGQLRDLEAERDTYLGRLAEVGVGGAFDENLRAAEEAAQMARGAYSEVVALEKLNCSYVSRARETGACPVCDQALFGAAANAFKSKCAALSHDLPGRKAAAAEQLEKCEAHLCAVQSAAPLGAQYEAANMKIAKLLEQQSLQSLKDELLRAAESLSAAEADLEVTKSNLTKLEELQLLVGWPLKQLSEQCENIKEALPPSAVPGEACAPRSLPEVETALQRAKEAVDSARRDLDAARSLAATRQERVIAAERIWRESREAGLRAREAGRARERASEVLQQCTAGESEASADLAGMLANMPAFEHAKEEAIAARTRARNVMMATLDTAGKLKMDSLKTYEHMVELHSCVSKWKVSSDAIKLKSICAQINGHEVVMASLLSEQEELEAKSEKCRKTLAAQESAKRALEDNLAFRRAQSEKEQLDQKVVGLRKEIGAAAGEALHNEKSELLRKESKIRQQQDLLRGASYAVQQRIDDAGKKMRSTELLDAEKMFSIKKVELETHESIVSDLDKYNKAMEKALVEYHESRMTAVNRIIRDLWRKAYKSGDIDYIIVRADAEGSSRGNYSYRLMMVTGGAELEMRGRCSAGQKVLACIIVRLALSEAFCIGCGIIALDEPTTNLDADNSNALARVLQEIIEARATQNNFQLLVITHDEDFAQQLGSKQFCEHYWLVRKDENQCSEVLKQDVLD